MGNAISHQFTPEEKERAACMEKEWRNKLKGQKSAPAPKVLPPPGFSRDTKIGPKYPDISDEPKIQDYRITHTKNLDEFYVQLLSDLETFLIWENRWNFWYDLYWTHDDDPEEPKYEADPVVNHFYVCYEANYNTWFRCKMVECLSGMGEKENEKRVLVQCIDYGFQIIVKVQYLYKLRERYVDAVPILARKGKLYNEDKNCTWTDGDKEYFMKIVKARNWGIWVKLVTMKSYRIQNEFLVLNVKVGEPLDINADYEYLDMRGKIRLW